MKTLVKGKNFCSAKNVGKSATSQVRWIVLLVCVNHYFSHTIKRYVAEAAKDFKYNNRRIAHKEAALLTDTLCQGVLLRLLVIMLRRSFISNRR